MELPGRAPVPAPTGEEGTHERALAGFSVLVCDDTPAKRYVIASWLRRDGYTVLEAETGAQALEIAAEGTSTSPSSTCTCPT